MSNSSELAIDSFNLSQRLCLRLLSKLEVGSLAIHDGGETYHFGCSDERMQLHAEVHVHDRDMYGQLLTGGTIAAGESYMQGYWSSPDLVAVMRLFSANLATLQSIDGNRSWLSAISLRIAHAFKRNSRAGARKNIAAHYDLGNDFFQLFLDPSMMYSSALFNSDKTTLEEASVAKMEELCQQLALHSDDHLIEIGTGWGGMAIYAARNYGCRVTTTTISHEQYEYALAQVEQAGLQKQITVLCEDYRNLHGSFDKLLSVEMIEAVGHNYYTSYFQCCSRLLKPDGKMVIQAITIADQRYEAAHNSVDFIQRYIFPGGSLPSVAIIADHIAEDTDMQMIHLRDITRDYALTLSHWRQRFLAAQSAVDQMGFEQPFIRMWEFYLAYCEGGFRERVIGSVQLAFAKPAYRFEAK